MTAVHKLCEREPLGEAKRAFVAYVDCDKSTTFYELLTSQHPDLIAR